MSENMVRRSNSAFLSIVKTMLIELNMELERFLDVFFQWKESLLANINHNSKIETIRLFLNSNVLIRGKSSSNEMLNIIMLCELFSIKILFTRRYEILDFMLYSYSGESLGEALFEIDLSLEENIFASSLLAKRSSEIDLYEMVNSNFSATKFWNSVKNIVLEKEFGCLFSVKKSNSIKDLSKQYLLNQFDYNTQEEISEYLSIKEIPSFNADIDGAFMFLRLGELDNVFKYGM